MSRTKTRKLGRMEFGFKSVQAAIEHEKNISGDFKSHIKNIPIYITVNGLIPTIAFIMAKGQKVVSYKFIGEKLVDYIVKLGLVNDNTSSLEKLLEQLFEMSTTDYRKCTLEVLAVLKWLVKFAEGMIITEPGESK